jgi:hypothetical protein
VLPVSLDCPVLIAPSLFCFSSSCVQCVTSVSGLSSVDCPVFVLFFLVLCTMCYQFLWIVQCWLPLQYFPRLVSNVLPVSLDCPVLIAPSLFCFSSSCVQCVTSVSGLSSVDCPFFVLFFLVLCTMCYQFLWIVQCWLTLQYSLRLVSCIPYVTSFSGLSSVDCPFRIFLVLCPMCYQCLWIVQCWLPLLCFVFPRLVYNVLPVSLDCPFLIALSVFSLSCVLYTICYKFLWIVQCWLPLQYFPRFVYNVLPVSLDCSVLIAPSLFCFSLSCLQYVVSFSGLSSVDCPFVLSVSLDCPVLIAPSCYQVLWIVQCWLPLRVTSFSGLSSVYCPFVLPGSLDCPVLIAPSCYQFLWIVQCWLPLRVTRFFGLSSVDCPFVLTVSLDCPVLIVPSVFSNVYCNMFSRSNICDIFYHQQNQ